MTILIQSFAKWKTIRSQFPPNIKIGFVPTMGNLHVGHMSLCARSQLENEVTVVSIFVNPTQFNDANDLEKYPRSLDADVALLSEQKVDYCLLPDASEMYADDYAYQVSEHQFSSMLEGPLRPGHFTGVLTIVMKLLLGVGCHKAYFGEKDFQQYRLISGMVKSFFMDCEVIFCPTIREASGLPFSSRNSRLSETEKAIAAQFAIVFNQKHLPLEELRQQLQPLPIHIDYLTEFDKRRFIAVRIGAIRILDNYASI